MYQVLSKDMIELEIVPYLPEQKRGFKPKAPLCEIVNAILYKLKTGVQWELLPVGSLFRVSFNSKTCETTSNIWMHGNLVG